MFVEDRFELEKLEIGINQILEEDQRYYLQIKERFIIDIFSDLNTYLNNFEVCVPVKRIKEVLKNKKSDCEIDYNPTDHFKGDDYVSVTLSQGNYGVHAKLGTRPLTMGLSLTRELIFYHFSIISTEKCVEAELALKEGAMLMLKSTKRHELISLYKDKRGVIFQPEELIDDDYVIKFMPATFDKVNLLF